MPKRTDDHILQEEAFAQFTLELHPRWLVREKDKDYGIDLEAELLGDDDGPTGQLFYVQSKATGQQAEERSVAIKVDRLDYLQSFDAPGMVVRYCAPTKSMYWMWATEARSLAKPGTKSVTLKFGAEHKWDENTLTQIERTLPVLRRLKRLDPMTRFAIRSAPGSDTIAVQRISDRLSRTFSAIFRGGDAVPIELAISDKEVSASIERVSKFSCVLMSIDIDDIETATLYVLASLLGTIGHLSQASAIALHCLKARRVVQDDGLAACASIAVLRHAGSEQAVDLAILNGLHMHQDFGHAMFRGWLMLQQAEIQGVDQAYIAFYEAVITAHQDREEPIGAIRYSLGNYLYNRRQYARAVSNFNQARRDTPDYWNRPYFLNELGATFFYARRYNASVKAYQCAFDISPDERTRFTLADAALHARMFDRSRNLFQPLLSLKSSLGAEAALKVGLAHWAEQNGSISIGDHKTLLALRDAATTSKDLESRFFAHLGITFCSEDDVPCWADAIALAFVSTDIGLLYDVMMMSVQRAGVEAYALFKDERCQEFQLDAGLTDTLDQSVMGIVELIEQERS